MSGIPRLTYQQYRAVRRLVHDCCNYDNGNCLALDDGWESCVCVQSISYTAIGDTVNTSARLEANAPGGTIYISRAVADALEGRIRTTSLGDSIKLKGKAEGFEVLILEEIL